MKIALDFANPIAGGCMSYLKEMLTYLPEVDQENEYLLLVAKYRYDMIRDYLPVNGVRCIIVPHVNHTVYRFFWMQIGLPFVLRRERADVLFTLNSLAPLLRLKCKKVVVVGTVGPFLEEFVQMFDVLERIKLRILEKAIVIVTKLADMTIFESKFTRDLFVDKYAYKGRHCINRHGRPIVGDDDYNPESIARVRKKYGLANEYFLYITDVRRYKNIERLIVAFASVRKRAKKGIDCVVAGAILSDAYLRELLDLCRIYGVEDSFYFVGKCDYYEELPYLRLGCLGFVFPTKYENLSLSLIEALTYGLPIITSTGTAMPETCQDAAIYFEPEDTHGLADAMLALADDVELRETLKQKSLKRALHFRDIRDEISFNLEIFREVCGVSVKM